MANSGMWVPISFFVCCFLIFCFEFVVAAFMLLTGTVQADYDEQAVKPTRS